ncbi:MAG TPA: Hpt domain-containing protein [Burkholderiales bacterium]|jgi:HPt (histidine-containing phosphotransfer) domain-containing protein
MTQDARTVKVSKDLEDLIPTYLTNRRKELDTLRQALPAADFEQIRQIGHRMRGVGASYGFDDVTALGKLLEDSAKANDKPGLEKHIAAYGEYLANLNITYE